MRGMSWVLLLVLQEQQAATVCMIVLTSRCYYLLEKGIRYLDRGSLSYELQILLCEII